MPGRMPQASALLPARGIRLLTSFILTAVLIFSAAAVLFTEACHRASSSQEKARITAAQVSVKKTRAALSAVVAELHQGDDVEVLAHEARWLRIRTSKGQEGWIEETAAQNQSILDAEKKLMSESKGESVQALGSLQSVANLHVTPGRDTPVYTRLQKDEKLEIFDRTLTDRPGTSKTSNSTETPSESGPKKDPWLKVRSSNGSVGWVYSPSVDFDVPAAIATYAESRRIVAWQVLNQVEGDNGAKVNQYVVADVEPGIAPEYDFDRIRVFTWNKRRNRYETAYRENRIRGVYPIRVFAYENKPAFEVKLLAEGDQNARPTVERYFMNGVLVRPIGWTPPAAKARSTRHRKR